MKLLIPIVTFFTCYLLFFSCSHQEKTRRIEDYYYPINDLQEGKVYEYQSVGNVNDPPIYWHFKRTTENGKEYLLGVSYDQAFSPDQSIREEKVGNGMLLDAYFTFEKDSLGNKQKVEAHIEDANVFPFEVKDPPGVLLTTIRWRPLTDTVTYVFVRNRQFEKDTTFTFQDKLLEAIKFNVRELVDQEVEGHLELEYGATEIYAKGIGLVYFSKDISDGWHMRYALKEIYDIIAFKQKFNTELPDIE